MFQYIWCSSRPSNQIFRIDSKHVLWMQKSFAFEEEAFESEDQRRVKDQKRGNMLWCERHFCVNWESSRLMKAYYTDISRNVVGKAHKCTQEE